MKIVVITGIAPPEPLTAGRLNWDLANHLAEEGNRVWLISPKPSRPLGVNYPKINGNAVRKVNDNLFHINVESFTYPRFNFLCRAYESLDFGIKSIRYVNRNINDHDLIYVSSWPFFCYLMVALLRRNKKSALIINIQDLYPESFLIRIKSKAVASLFHPLYLIDRLTTQRATHITVISESFRQAYLRKRKVLESKISVIQNWQDSEEFIKTVPSKSDVIKKFKLTETRGKFIYMYLGNLGPVAGIETLLYSFEKLDPERSFLIIAGSGTARERCRLLSKKLKIENISFTEVPPELKSVVELQSIADVLLLPINPEAANSSIPSKLIAYMFSGKPVITSAAHDSETAGAIKASECGWITQTNDPSEWADVMETALRSSGDTLKKMGRSGFDYAIKNYSKSEGLRKISDLISRI